MIRKGNNTKAEYIVYGNELLFMSVKKVRAVAAKYIKKIRGKGLRTLYQKTLEKLRDP